MNSGTVIIGLVMLLMVTLPFVITIRSRKKKKQQALMALNKFAAKHNHFITKHENCGKFTIGLDEKNNYLYFRSNTNKENNLQTVDLSKIKKCVMVQQLDSGQSLGKITNNLYLNFYPKDKSSEVISLEFFNREISLDLNGEVQAAEEWEKEISSRLK